MEVSFYNHGCRGARHGMSYTKSAFQVFFTEVSINEYRE